MIFCKLCVLFHLGYALVDTRPYNNVSPSEYYGIENSTNFKVNTYFTCKNASAFYKFPNGSVVTTKHNKTVYFNQSTFALHFKRLLLSHNGTYTFNCSNKLPSHLDLHVQYPVKMLSPHLKSTPSKNSFQLFCNVIGNPTPRITWFLSNKYSNGDITNTSIFKAYTPDGILQKLTWRSSILNVPRRLENEPSKRSYECKAQNTLHNNVTTFVSGGPFLINSSQKPKKLPVIPGENDSCNGVYSGTYCSKYINGSQKYKNRQDYVALDSEIEKIINSVADYKQSTFCTNILRKILCIASFLPCHPKLPICREQCNRVKELCHSEIIKHENSVTAICDYLPLSNNNNNCQFINVFDSLDQLRCVPDQAQLNPYFYVGKQDKTNGVLCKSWGEAAKYITKLNLTLHPELDSNENYCRHFYEENLNIPGCYIARTTHDDLQFQTCDIEQCSQPFWYGLASFLGLNVVYFWYYVMLGFAVLLILLVLGIGIFLCCYHYRSNHDLDENIQLEKLRENPLYNQSPYPNQTFLSPSSSCNRPTTSLASYNLQDQNFDSAKLNYLNHSYNIRQNNYFYRSQVRERWGFSKLEYDRNKIEYLFDIGHGSSGRVFKAKAAGLGTTDSVVAVKMLREEASDKKQENFEREAYLLSTFNHPNIIKLLAVCSVGRPFCLILDYMLNGDLNHFLRGCDPNHYVKNVSKGYELAYADQILLAQQVASGMAYISEKCFIHRDLATRNCLVTNHLIVKIADFGLSQYIGDQDYLLVSEEDEIPIRWMAPEVLFHNKYTKMSDVWAFGVLLWEIFAYALQPYYGMSNYEIFQYISNGHVLLNPCAPADIYEVMLGCWARVPSKRYSFRTLYEILDSLLKFYTSKTDSKC